jgi:urease accessory protein
MQLKPVYTALLTLITLLAAPYAAAHTGVHLANGLADGFMHPLSGLDHLLIAIGAGFCAGRTARCCVCDVTIFLLLLLGGMALGALSLAWPQLGIPTLVLIALVVGVIAMSTAFTGYFGYAFFGGFAIYHGLVHILEIPTVTEAAGYAVGLFFSTAILLALGVMLRQVMHARKFHRVNS